MLKSFSEFKLLYHPRSLKFLKKIPKTQAAKIIIKLEILETDPKSSSLDAKKLVSTRNGFRLRIGNVRVVYEIDQASKTIYTQAIDFRGNIY